MATRTAYVATQSAGDVLTSANFSKLPGGWIGYVEVTSNQASITTETDLTSLTLTVTVNTDRKVKIDAEVGFFSSVANDACGLAITNSGNTHLQECQVVSITNAYAVKAKCALVTNPSSGSNTWKLRGQRAAGTGNVTMYAAATAPSYIYITDEGPSS